MIPKIRSATLSDLNTLKKFQQELVKYERPFDSGIPSKGVVNYYNLTELIKSYNTKFLVAESDKTVIGCGFGQIRKNVEWAVNKKYGYIGLMYVDKKFRGKKIGKSIAEELIKWFREKKILSIRLQVYHKNKPAVNAYRKYGFSDFIMEMQYGL